MLRSSVTAEMFPSPVFVMLNESVPYVLSLIPEFGVIEMSVACVTESVG